MNEQEMNNKRCCVPLCKNTSDSISTSDGEGKGISFHGFPSEEHLRATWLRVLGKQDSHLPDSAMVCSQHFLNDDIYDTECGLRQIVTGAIPSTVQVCMICLDTDSKLILMSKHKLEETYEKLTGYPLCDKGNLKQTLCVQCAHRLINFSRFRDKSLRARALMMDLVDKHEFITRRHIKMINRTKHQLKSSMVLTTLGPDHCDLHILEHPSEDKLTELEEIGFKGEVKTEGSDDAMWFDVDMEVKHEEDNNVNDIFQDPLKYESASFQCTLCFEEFFHEHAYMQHMSVHLQNGAGDGECDTSQVCKPHTAVSSSSSHSSLITENKQADLSPYARAAQTSVVPPSASLVKNDEVNPTEAVDTNVSRQYKRLTDCFVKQYVNFAKKVVQRQDGSLIKTRRDAMSCDSLNTVSEDFSHQATSQNEVPATEYIEPVTNSSSRVKKTVSKTLQSKTDGINNTQCNNSSQYSSQTAKSSFSCDICGKFYNKKFLLVKHVKTHSEIRQFACKICQHKSQFKSLLARHMRTHTGEKPFTCNICNSKFTQRTSLECHMRIHTGAKPFTCNICNDKFTQRSSLVCHMRTHTGIKPHACELCEYKSGNKSGLVRHMSTHTGIKPYACELCEYKSGNKSGLVRHMSTHTGIKPYACELCEYKSVKKSGLVSHMRSHTGIKPYACEYCEYKCSRKNDLIRHMRIHTGENPYSCNICGRNFVLSRSLMLHMSTHSGIKPHGCELCEYKSARKSDLVSHMRTHTGEKPFICTICNRKFAQNYVLQQHMKTHTKPYLCDLCVFKCANKNSLEAHMSTHTGIKPYACELCEYKCAQKCSLVFHMRIHTGEKPYSCQKCEYKCAYQSNLVRHMRIHTGRSLFPTGHSGQEPRAPQSMGTP